MYLERAELIDRFEGLGRALAGKFRHWSLEPDDLRQCAALAIIEAVDSWDGGDVPLSAWVAMRIRWALANEIAAAIRQTQRTRHHQLEPTDQADDPRLESIIDELWNAIDDLPRLDRRILIQQFGLDRRPPRTRAEISIKLGCRPAAITASRQRAIATLRGTLSA
jgi:RNA polymerase sigma factor (sigma-70 family)